MAKDTHLDMILVTGATGFLGRYIIDELLLNGHDIRILVRNASKRKLPWAGLVEIVEGDILDVLALEKAFEGVDYVIHVAAMVSFWKRKREDMLKINIDGTANIVNACLEHNVKRLVHISSIAAVGKEEDGSLVRESNKWTVGKFTSNYALSKYKSEREVVRGVAEGLSAVMLNPGLIIGPGNWSQGTPKMYKIMSQGLSFYNSGTFGIVAGVDVAKAAVMMMEEEVDNGDRFILVAENISQKDYFSKIADELGVKRPKFKLPPWLTLFVGFISEGLSNLRGKEPLISRESMRSSVAQFRYDGSKILSYDFEYSSIEDIVKETAKAFIDQNS